MAAKQNNFEKLIEYIVNGETEKAEALFHDVVVEKSRTIYEGLVEEEMQDVDIDEATKDEDEDEDKVDEATKDEDEDEDKVDESFESFEEIGGDPTDDMIASVAPGAEADSEFDPTVSMDGDQGQGDVETRIMDVEDELENLKAEFERLINGDSEEGSDDMDSMDSMDSEEGEEENGNPFAKSAEKESFNAFEEIEEIDLSPAEQMREYVEKIGDAYKGGKVASSSETGSPNTKSPIAGKNDMGGTTKNIAQGSTGSEKGTAGGLLNPSTKEDNAGNVNVPGAKSATKLSPVSKGHGAEKKGAGEDAQNKKSIIGSK